MGMHKRQERREEILRLLSGGSLTPSTLRLALDGRGLHIASRQLERDLAEMVASAAVCRVGFGLYSVTTKWRGETIQMAGSPPSKWRGETIQMAGSPPSSRAGTSSSTYNSSLKKKIAAAATFESTERGRTDADPAICRPRHLETKARHLETKHDTEMRRTIARLADEVAALRREIQEMRREGARRQPTPLADPVPSVPVVSSEMSAKLDRAADQRLRERLQAVENGKASPMASPEGWRFKVREALARDHEGLERVLKRADVREKAEAKHREIVAQRADEARRWEAQIAAEREALRKRAQAIGREAPATPRPQPITPTTTTVRGNEGSILDALRAQSFQVTAERAQRTFAPEVTRTNTDG